MSWLCTRCYYSFFPHNFLVGEDLLQYHGPIPGKQFFFEHTRCKNARDKEEFDQWYETQRGRLDWDVRTESTLYCIDDCMVRTQSRAGGGICVIGVDASTVTRISEYS